MVQGEFVKGYQMKKILFITSRNIINTCGELRLIKNRARVLYERYGFATDFLVFTHKKSQRPEEINAGGNLLAYQYNILSPIDMTIKYNKFKKLVLKKISGDEYDLVILSGANILNLVDIIKKVNNNLLVFADIHGAFEELIEFPAERKVKAIAQKMFYKYVKKVENTYIRKFDHILAVSESLKRYLVSQYHVECNRIHIVPCSIEQVCLDVEKAKKQRSLAREKYGIADDEKLFIYSGGVSKWQCIEETVQMFQKICEECEGKSKLLILSGSKAIISQYASEKIVIDSLEASEVAKTLLAGDYAFLLRANYVTNNVAYPNKFLEYVSAGLKVVTTPFVDDVAEAVRKYNLGYVLNNVEYENQFKEYYEANHGEYGDDFDRRQELIDNICFEKCLQFFEGL